MNLPLQKRSLLFLVVGLNSIAVARAAEPPPSFYAPLDDSPHATVANGALQATVQGQVNYVPGVRGRAAVVGSQGHLVYLASQNFHPEQGTLSLWMRPVDWEGGDDQFHFLFFCASETPSTRERLLLYKFFKSDLLTALWDGPKGVSPALLQAPHEWDPQHWRHYALTWSATELALFLDGDQIGRTHRETPKATDITYFLLGYGYFIPNETGNQALDEVRLYEEVLTAEQILALYKLDAAGAARK